MDFPNFESEVRRRNTGNYGVGTKSKSNVNTLEKTYFFDGKPVQMTEPEYNKVRYGTGVNTKVRQSVLDQIYQPGENRSDPPPSKWGGNVVRRGVEPNAKPNPLQYNPYGEGLPGGEYDRRGPSLPSDENYYKRNNGPTIPSDADYYRRKPIVKPDAAPPSTQDPAPNRFNPNQPGKPSSSGTYNPTGTGTGVNPLTGKQNPAYIPDPPRGPSYTSQQPNPYRDTYKSPTLDRAPMQAPRINAPSVGGIAGGINQVLQEVKLWTDAVDTMEDYRNTLKNLGVTREEEKRLEKYGDPKYVDGLEKSLNMSNGANPYDGLTVNDVYDRVRAMRRGEDPDRFKERMYGPQTKEGAELYRYDYKNGPIFKPGGIGFQLNPFKPGFGPTIGTDGYTDEQREGLNDAARRSVGGYYGRGLKDKVAQLGRQISADFFNDYKSVLKNEKLRQQLEKAESRRNRKYWDDFDRNPNKQSRQRSLDRESRRNLQDYEEESRRLDAESERNRDPFKAQRDSDLQKTIEWNRANPQRETFQDKQRRETLEYWQRNDPSKIGNSYDPWKSAPLPDPERDPDYPPLPPGLKYPIWGWSIESVSSPRYGGLTVPIFWYSEYIKDASWVGDMPEPYADNYDGNSIIQNTGGWQAGRSGLVILDNLQFGSPPQFVGGDEREIITEAEGRAKWGMAWDFGYNDPRWDNSPFRSKKEEILEDVRRVPYKGRSNFVPGGTTITRKTPLRGKQPVPDTRPQSPPKPEPDDPIMPGCSYQPDKQNPAIVSWWDKLTNSIKKKPISVHEGVDEGFEHISLQMAQLQEQINKISQVLDVEKYTAPQGKVVAPVLGMQAITTVLGSSNPLAPIPLVKTLPQENLIFAAINYMFSGHHLLGKMQLPIDPNKGADALGNMQRVTPLTSMGYMHQMYNNLSGMIGMPSAHTVVDANGVKAPLQFKNQSDATENVHNNTVQIQQDISSLQEAVFKILQNQEAIINMSHRIGYQAQFLMDDTGARVKNIMVQRPTVMKHGKKPDPSSQTGTTREFNWGNVFTIGTAATSVPTWDQSNDLDKMQLGLKTNIEAQKAASSNFYPISAKADTQAIPSLKSKRDGTWESYVKTINDGSEGKIYHGIAVPESKIEYIKGGVKREVVTSNKPFIDGRDVE